MAFRNIRPLHVLWQRGVTQEMLEGIKDGVRTILSLAGVSNEIAIEYHGQRGESEWLIPGGRLNPEMNTIHELGHVFGLCGEQESHCPNDCVMYWQESDALYEKIRDQPFCPDCLKKLPPFFIEP